MTTQKISSKLSILLFAGFVFGIMASIMFVPTTYAGYKYHGVSDGTENAVRYAATNVKVYGSGCNDVFPWVAAGSGSSGDSINQVGACGSDKKMTARFGGVSNIWTRINNDYGGWTSGNGIYGSASLASGTYSSKVAGNTFGGRQIWGHSQNDSYNYISTFKGRSPKQTDIQCVTSNGLSLIKKTFTLSSADVYAAQSGGYVSLDIIADDWFSAWFNGSFVGMSTYTIGQTSVNVGTYQLRQGTNTLAIAVADKYYAYNTASGCSSGSAGAATAFAIKITGSSSGNSCPSGTTGSYPNCVNSPPPAQCPSGTTGTPPNCYTPPPVGQCPPGTTGTYPNCATTSVCPPNTSGTYPNCSCRPGFVDSNPSVTGCQPTPACPTGSSGMYPNCTCNTGYQDGDASLPGCQPTPVPPCPSGSTGTYPNCVCSPGFKDSNASLPGCQPTPDVCPPNTWGTLPNCSCNIGFEDSNPSQVGCQPVPIPPRDPYSLDAFTACAQTTVAPGQTVLCRHTIYFGAFGTATQSMPTNTEIMCTVNGTLLTQTGVNDPYKCRDTLPSVIYYRASAKSYDYNVTAPAGAKDGDKICVYATVDPGLVQGDGTLSQRNKAGNTICVTVSAAKPPTKNPAVHIRGGDVSVGRPFTGGSPNTSAAVATTKISVDGGSFGSWVEYGILAPAAVTSVSGGRLSGSTGGGAVMPADGDLNKMTYANDATPYGRFTPVVGVIPDVMSTFKNPVTSGFPGIKNATSEYYRVNGDVTIAKTGDNVVNRTLVIQVDGKVTINDDISYNTATVSTAAQLPQLIIYARDGIYISDAVSNIDGWLISPKLVNTCGTVDPPSTFFSDLTTGNACNSRALTINGPVMTSKLYLRRTFGGDTGSRNIAAETINLRPDVYLWSMARSSTGGVPLPTANIKEMPPRL